MRPEKNTSNDSELDERERDCDQPVVEGDSH